MDQKRRRALVRDARIFTAGAACGLLAGAFLVAALVWQFGNVIGSRAWARADSAPVSAVQRWTAAMDDAGPGIIEQGDDRAVSTTGHPGDDAAVARTTPSIAPPANSPAELADRDLEMPVEGVRPDQLTRQFHDKRGDSREHEAIDIPAPRNTPVHAVDNGRIARLFLSKAGGITVYQFDPTERYCYYYAHLERYADGLREGQTVTKGQVIGYVGTSGNAPPDTPHLHFAVFKLTAEKRWWEGTPIDPYDLLK